MYMRASDYKKRNEIEYCNQKSEPEIQSLIYLCKGWVVSLQVISDGKYIHKKANIIQRLLSLSELLMLNPGRVRKSTLDSILKDAKNLYKESLT